MPLQGTPVFDQDNKELVEGEAPSTVPGASVSLTLEMTHQVADADGNQLGALAVDVLGGAPGGVAGVAGNPTATNIGADTPWSFSKRVNHFLIQNNTTATVYVELDAAASTASLAIAAGTSWRDDIEVTAVHLYTAAAQNINAASGIVIRGWL